MDRDIIKSEISRLDALIADLDRRAEAIATQRAEASAAQASFQHTLDFLLKQSDKRQSKTSAGEDKASKGKKGKTQQWRELVLDFLQEQGGEAHIADIHTFLRENGISIKAASLSAGISRWAKDEGSLVELVKGKRGVWGLIDREGQTNTATETQEDET